MITKGPCGECGSPLAADQRYCINCGARVGPPLAMPYAPAAPAQAAAPAQTGFWAFLPMPIQTATAAAALALGFGVIAGTAISPGLAGPLAGPVVVAVPSEAPPAPAPEPASSGGGSGGGSAPAPSPEPVTVAAAPTDTGTEDTGGDGKSRKQKKPKVKPTYISGTVIHANPVAVSYSVSSGGSVSAVHTKSAAALPPVGTVVRVPVRLLRNRTFAEDGKRQDKGQAGDASFSGVVTHAVDSTDPAIPDTYTVSLRGWSALVHMPPEPTANPADEQHPPPLGGFATVSAELRATPAPPTPAFAQPHPCTPPPAQVFPSPAVVPAKELHQTGLVIGAGTPPTSVQIETVVQGACASPAGQALFSSDDVREGASDLMVPPNGIDVAQLTAGTPVIANLTLAGGALTGVTGVQSDAGIGGADGTAGSQGDLK